MPEVCGRASLLSVPHVKPLPFPFSSTAIIGKGGKNIQDLRLKHHCQIQMADCDAPERVLIVNGDQADVLNCIGDIISSILENHQRSSKPDQSEVRALVHQSQAGALIGK